MRLLDAALLDIGYGIWDAALLDVGYGIWDKDIKGYEKDYINSVICRLALGMGRGTCVGNGVG